MSRDTPPRPSGGHEPEPSFGPDEEGEVPHHPPAQDDDRNGAWVKKDEAEEKRSGG